jgi:glycosyltransferase involved in cell wall biosynthesis
VRKVAGVQCNGLPTYRAYHRKARDALLFFDSRVSASMVVSVEQMRARLAMCRKRSCLRLAFSGRFAAMKGVHHLPEVAHWLAQKTSFELHLCGGGALEPYVRERVRALGLEPHVRFHGVLDFETELMPFMREHIDLFVAPHPQGDPSCTYLETFACGVPVVGYDNEALRGLALHTGAAFTTPLDDPRSVAERIVSLSQDHAALERASLAARSFAARHTFDRTFARRVEQLIRLSRYRPPASPSLAAELAP